MVNKKYNKTELKKEIELDIIKQVVRLHDIGMDSKTAMDIITSILWNGNSSIVDEVKTKMPPMSEIDKSFDIPEFNSDMPKFNDDFDELIDDTKNIKNMKGGLIK